MITTSNEIKGMPVNVYDHRGNHLGFMRQNFFLSVWEAHSGSGCFAKFLGFAPGPDVARLIVETSRADGASKVLLCLS